MPKNLQKNEQQSSSMQAIKHFEIDQEIQVLIFNARYLVLQLDYFFIIYIWYITKMLTVKGWVCSSAVDCLPSMCNALNWITSNEKKKSQN